MRRKAAQSGPNAASLSVEAHPVAIAQINDEIEASAPPRKKRKKSKTSKPVIEHQHLSNEYPAVDDGSHPASDAGLEVNEPNDTNQELEIVTYADCHHMHIVGLTDLL